VCMPRAGYNSEPSHRRACGRPGGEWHAERASVLRQMILDTIPFQADLAALRQQLRLRGNGQADRVRSLAAEARAIARPKAIYRSVSVESKGDDFLVIDGVRFDSRVLRVQLGDADHIFPHIITCGEELYGWAHGIEDMLERFWADAIVTQGLRAAGRALNEHLAERYRPGKTCYISPGVFPDFPIQQQRPLFRLLGDPRAAIGVRLLKSFLMEPFRTNSGFIFSTEEDFVICELCGTETCSGRRLPFDKGLFDRKYRLNG
jgi:hypothetical protein